MQKTKEENKGYQELLQKQGEEEALSQLANSAAQLKGVIRCTQCGQVGHMRTNRNCPLYMADEARMKVSTAVSNSTERKADGDGGNTPNSSEEKSLRLRVKSSASLLEDLDMKPSKITVNLSELREGARKHQIEKKRKRMQEVKEQAEIYKRPYMNPMVKQSRSRMPVTHLNGNLELVIQELLEMDESELFRIPVDGTVVKDYYRVIKHPMDLTTMKTKIQNTEYLSIRDFIKDLELVVNNSKAYNGDASRSLITANAVKLLKRAQEKMKNINAEGGIPSTSTIPETAG